MDTTEEGGQMNDQDELSEALDRAEIIEGEIAEAEFHKDKRAEVRLTAKLDQAKAEVRDLKNNK